MIHPSTRNANNGVEDLKADSHALHAASSGGHVRVVQMLLEKGADVNVLRRWLLQHQRSPNCFTDGTRESDSDAAGEGSR